MKKVNLICLKCARLIRAHVTDVRRCQCGAGELKVLSSEAAQVAARLERKDRLAWLQAGARFRRKGRKWVPA